ncbi:MAG: polysaccharide deacetylase family protein [Clostridia bacterium]|nr:polysaccharide deacetylase family protein [Clostridia bacterium]
MKRTAFWRIMCAFLAMMIVLAVAGCDSTATGGGDVTETSSDTPKKKVAMTFDDGPHNVRTRAIVDELAKYGFNATFFVVGNRVDGTEMNCEATVRYIIEKGNEVGIHGYTHDVYYNSCSDEEYEYELKQTKKAITVASHGYKVSLMRPIGGAISAERAAECEYSVILWDVDSLDYEHRYSSSDAEGATEKRDTIVDNVMSQVKDGSIILMHDIYQSTVDATAVILKRLHEEGYEVVTVSELIGDPQPGVKYFNGN